MDYKKTKKVSWSAFLDLLKKVKKFESVDKNKKYIVKSIVDNRLTFLRLDSGNSGKEEILNLEKVFLAFNNLTVLNTSTIKPYVSGKQSPTMALLKKIEIIKDYNPLDENTI